MVMVWWSMMVASLWRAVVMMMAEVSDHPLHMLLKLSWKACFGATAQRDLDFERLPRTGDFQSDRATRRQAPDDFADLLRVLHFFSVKREKMVADQHPGLGLSVVVLSRVAALPWRSLPRRTPTLSRWP